MNNTSPVRDKFESLKATITHLLKQGYTYPQIARMLSVGNAETLRHWIVKHPKLDAIRRRNGKMRMLIQDWRE